MNLNLPPTDRAVQYTEYEIRARSDGSQTKLIHGKPPCSYYCSCTETFPLARVKLKCAVILQHAVQFIE